MKTKMIMLGVAIQLFQAHATQWGGYDWYYGYDSYAAMPFRGNYLYMVSPQPRGEFVIPTIQLQDGIGFVGIKENTFKDCSQMTSVYIPESVLKVGQYAFSGCTNLESAVWNPYTSYSGIDLEIPFGMFYGCKKLKSFQVPSMIGQIGGAAFLGCGLEEINIPASVKNIAGAAFGNCNSLTNFVVANDNRYFKSVDGMLCDAEASQLIVCPCGLKEARIPQGITSIANAAFYNSDTLQMAIIPGTVSTIAWSAFYSCSELKSVVFCGEMPAEANEGMYSNMRTDFVTYVLGSKKSWGNALKDGMWKGYPIKVLVEQPLFEGYAETFETASQEVTLSCETDGATIYYTIDGSEPSATNGRKYKGPFDIYQTTTVKAIAVKDDWKDSAVASAMFTKENAIGPAINLLEVLPDNDKTHPWEVVTDVTHDGVSAVKSGAIEDDETTALKAVIYGAGELSFWWKASCEPSIDGEFYDYGTFFNGSTVVTNIAGKTDWQQVTIKVSGAGKHTFKWTYQKDDSGSTIPDGIWLDQVQWLPETTDYYADHTLTTEVPVEYKWLRQYGLGVTNDFEQAAKAKTGKRDGTGRELTVEHDYVAGTNPTNATSQFKAFINCSTGVPDITWDPDLADKRTYKIWGSENLANWEWPTNNLHRFFKVTVEMP